jgi:hypothetical protein
LSSGTVYGTIVVMQPAPAYTNTVRIGYARVSGRSQDHQMQLDALATANCREVIVETASTRGARPRLTVTLDTLRPGDTLVVYKPDRIARSMKELLVLLEDELHAREVNLEILTGICAGLHKPNGQTIADKMLFMVAAMAAEMERDLVQERSSSAAMRVTPSLTTSKPNAQATSANRPRHYSWPRPRSGPGGQADGSHPVRSTPSSARSSLHQST